MRGKWLAIPAAAVILGAGVGALTFRRNSRAAGPGGGAKATASAHPEIILSGIVRPRHVVRVGAPAGGPVAALAVEAGQEVYQGEVLARVGEAGDEAVRDGTLQAVERAQDDVTRSEAQVISARLEAARAGAASEASQIALERARRVYDRQKMLNDAGATPRLVYEKADQEYRSCQQEYAAAQIAVRAAADATEAANVTLENAKQALAARKAESETAQLAFAAAEVRSPVDGFLAAMHAEVGRRAEKDEVLFEIATDLETLEVAASAQPEVLTRIRPGQAAMVVAEGGGGGLAGVVRGIQDSQAIVEFHSAAAAIKPGAEARVQLKLE